MKLRHLVLNIIVLLLFSINGQAQVTTETISLEIQDWLEIFQWAPKDSPVEKIAIEQLMRLPSTAQELSLVYISLSCHQTEADIDQIKLRLLNKLETEKIDFEDLLAVCDCLEADDPDWGKLLVIMEKSATTFEDWYWSYFKIPETYSLKQQAWEKFIELAIDCPTWCYIYDSLMSNDEPDNKLLKTLAWKEIQKLATTFEDWDFIFNYSEEENELSVEALKNMADLANTAEHWLMIYSYHLFPDESEEQKKLLNEAVKLAVSFEEWFGIFQLAGEDDLLKTEALEKMAKKARIYEHHFALYAISPEHSKIETQALKDLEVTADNLGRWIELYRSLPNHLPLKRKSLEKIRDLAIDFESWQLIYFNSYLKDNDPLKPVALEKMAELAINAKHWVILEKLAPEDSLLRHKATMMVEAIPELIKLIDLP
jgi:hypothetical protein